MATVQYEHLQFVWLQMATEMLHTEAVGKYLKYPEQLDRVKAALATAYREIKATTASPGAPSPRACTPPFCDSGNKCVPCGLDQVFDASSPKLRSARVDGQRRQRRSPNVLERNHGRKSSRGGPRSRA